MNIQVNNSLKQQNPFLEKANDYEQLKEKYSNGYLQFKNNIQLASDQQYIQRHNQFMKYLKFSTSTLQKLKESTQKLSNLLTISKSESSNDNFEMYFYHSYYILDYFTKNYILDEIFIEKYNKKDIISYVILVLLIKNQGHSLVYDLFLGWAVFNTQVFVVPQPNLSAQEIPLLVQGQNQRATYHGLIKQASLILAALICINTKDLLQFLNSVNLQKIFNNQNNSYDEVFTTNDEEQQSCYFQFIQLFFNHSNEHINHINIIILSDFIDLSYIQMKSYAQQSTQSIQSKYYQPLEQIKNSLLPQLQSTLNSFQTPENQDTIYKQICLSSTTLQILEFWMNKSIEKINCDETLFYNELQQENYEEILEKGIKVELPNNPFNFLEFNI